MLGSRLALAAIVSLCIAAPAAAQPKTFKGGDWDVAGNWEPPGVPTEADDVTVATNGVVNSAIAVKSLTLTGGTTTIDYPGTLTLAAGGTSTWSAGSIDMHDKSFVEIEGTLNIAGDVSNPIGSAGAPPEGQGTPRFHVHPGGTLAKVGGGGQASIGAQLLNEGSVTSASGTLRAYGPAGVDQPGAFATAAGGVLALRSMRLTTGVTGPGTLLIDNGAATEIAPLAAFDVGMLQFGGNGVLAIQGEGLAGRVAGDGISSGAGTLTVTGDSTIDGLHVRNGTVNFLADVTINASVYPECGGRLRFEGTTTWNGGFIDTHDAGVVENAGTFIPAGGALVHRIGSTGCAAGPMEFRNLIGATVQRSSGSSLDIHTKVVNSGTIDVTAGSMTASMGSRQLEGTWNMHGQTLNAIGGLNVEGGEFRSAGTINGAVALTGGFLVPGASPGLLTINGDYSQSGGTLEVEIAGTDPAGYDRLQVAGAAALGGTLDITTVAPFDPALTDTFPILAAAGDVTGTFTTVTGAQLTGKRYTPSYAQHAVVLGLAEGPANLGRPTIAPAQPRPGDTLTCSPGSWTANPAFTYLWLRDGIQAGAGETLPVTAADVGKSIVCRVTATSPGGSTDADSDPVVPLPLAPASTGTPVITPAAATAGDELTCDPGSWSGSPAFAFAWERDGAPVGTGATYTTVDADAGHPIVCAVTATNAGGSATARSAPVTPAARPVASPAPAPSPSPAPAPAPTPAAPAEPAVIRPAQVFTLPSAKRCVSRRRFRIRVRQPRNVKLRSVTVLVNGRRVKTNRGARVTAPVDLRGLPKGRFRVEIRVLTSTGRTIKDRRTYRTCAPKRRG